MKRKKISAVLLFLFSVCIFQLYSQDKPRLAIIPFSVIDAPASEGRIVSGLFETALVKTEVFRIIEQNQMGEILDAQAVSLSGCTDDSCAVEVGKLLSAEFIILGELSKAGERYYANVKIIDVELGRNVDADFVAADDIVELTESAIPLLAYKIAGFTGNTGGVEHTAVALGEIQYDISPGAECRIIGIMVDERISGRGLVDLPVGIYSVEITGENFEPYVDSITVHRLEPCMLMPKLIYKVEYLEIENNLLADTICQSRDPGSELEKVRSHIEDIDQQIDSSEDLIFKGEQLLKTAIRNRIDELDMLISDSDRRMKTLNLLRCAAFGAGGIGFLSSGIIYIIGESEFEIYNNAETSEAAAESRDMLAVYANLETAGLVSGSIGTLIGACIPWKDKNRESMEKELGRLSYELSELSGGIDS
ncbi:MAG: CsgG/HfaB family protein [Spirochaetales bacterium]|uniref:CsgG/HfaB family protein n=1 Tax=Candidatus Thalassospirochaeta sargassi TaxID=3119039 RepID=A0AAJ1MLR4_9SPIO|nr:CsgG/HfaB family protein [Spirochaetales bacterium]